MLTKLRTNKSRQGQRRSLLGVLQEAEEVDSERPPDTEAADAAPEAEDEDTDTDTAEPEDNDDETEDSGDEDKESVESARDRKPERRKGKRVKLVRRATAAVLIAVLTGAGYEAWLLFEQHQQHVAARQAVDAAKKYILVLTSVDPNAIDRNFNEVLDGSTGEFKDMYTRSSAQLRQALIDNKAAAHGNVVEAGVKSATTDKVEVVLFIDQAVSNASAPNPQMDRSRVQMTMEKVDGRWLASKVELP